MDIACAVESVITPTIRHLDELFLNTLALRQLHRIDEISSSEFLTPFFFRVVDINHNDLARFIIDASLNDAETNAASTKDGNIGSLINASSRSGRDDSSAVASCDAASQETRPIHGRLVGDGNDGYVSNNSILAEGARAHEMQQILALALESRCPVGHHALALRSAYLSAQVRLARLAELAFAAFGGIEGNDIVAWLDGSDALAHRFDDAGAFVAEDDGEGTLGVFAGERVGVCPD
jgi:hypothetical protein